jgi:hypothetical protein
LLSIFVARTDQLTQGIIVTDEQGQIIGGSRAEAELHMPGWPNGGNHWQPYAAEAAAAASSGFLPAPGLGAAVAGGYGVRKLNHHRLGSWGHQWQ